MPVIGLHVCGNCLLESDMKALVGAALIACWGLAPPTPTVKYT
jgi:hypothetical protein